MPDVVSTQVPLWGVFTHLAVFVGGWYAHQKFGQQAQKVADTITSAVAGIEKKL